MLHFSLQETDTSIEVRTPYHPDFPDQAERFGGEWISSHKSWRFDKSQKREVLEICQELYSGDTPDSKCVDVTINASNDHLKSNPEFSRALIRAIEIAVAQQEKPDGVPIAVPSGQIIVSGTSQTPLLRTKPETVIELGNVPLDLALHLKRLALEHVSLVDSETASSWDIGVLQNEYDDLLSHLGLLAETSTGHASAAYTTEVERCERRIFNLQAELDRRMLYFGGHDGRTPEPLNA